MDNGQVANSILGVWYFGETNFTVLSVLVFMGKHMLFKWFVIYNGMRAD